MSESSAAKRSDGPGVGDDGQVAGQQRTGGIADTPERGRRATQRGQQLVIEVANEVVEAPFPALDWKRADQGVQPGYRPQGQRLLEFARDLDGLGMQTREVLGFRVRPADVDEERSRPVAVSESIQARVGPRRPGRRTRAARRSTSGA